MTASLRRSRAKLTEHMRNALNAFLYQTGSPTTSFVLVLATNRAEDLDEAVLDRVDETLYFGLPRLDARESLVNLYYNVYVARLKRRPGRWHAIVNALKRAAAPLDVADDVTPRLLLDVAAATEDFSGREIEKLFVAVQSLAYGRGGKLEASTLRAAVANKRGEHQRKMAMNEVDSTLRSGAVDAAMRSPRRIGAVPGSPGGKSPGRRR